MLEHSRHVLLAVLLLAGKVAERLLPQGGLLLPVPLAHGHHLPVLLVLHVVVHHLLVPGPRRAHLSGSPGNRWAAARPRNPEHVQLALLVEVQDPVLEVVHLAEDQGLVKDVTEAATLQQGDGLRMQLLSDLGKETRGNSTGLCPQPTLLLAEDLPP